jgi:hypothetical protein
MPPPTKNNSAVTDEPTPANPHRQPRNFTSVQPDPPVPPKAPPPSRPCGPPPALPHPRPAVRQRTARPAPRRRRPPRPVAQRHRDPPERAPRAARSVDFFGSHTGSSGAVSASVASPRACPVATGVRQDPPDHRRLVNHRDQTTPTPAWTLHNIPFERQPHRHRPSQPTRILPGLLDRVMSQRRVRKTHAVLSSTRNRPSC